MDSFIFTQILGRFVYFGFVTFREFKGYKNVIFEINQIPVL